MVFIRYITVKWSTKDGTQRKGVYAQLCHDLWIDGKPKHVILAHLGPKDKATITPEVMAHVDATFPGLTVDWERLLKTQRRDEEN